MSGHPLLSTAPAERRTGSYLVGNVSTRDRALPSPGGIARRRFLINLTKWMLPAVAVTLLALVALWPEIDALTTRTRLAVSRVSGQVEGGKLIGARYNGIDEKGRPYTITAATAWQIGPEKVGLTLPQGDITMENGTWLSLKSETGSYIQHANQLDLVKNVTLYRDDGTIMLTQSASVDIKGGAAAGSEPVHAEGPFGVLDAQGFALMDKGAAIDFTGPAHVILNGAGH